MNFIEVDEMVLHFSSQKLVLRAQFYPKGIVFQMKYYLKSNYLNYHKHGKNNYDKTFKK